MVTIPGAATTTAVLTVVLATCGPLAFWQTGSGIQDPTRPLLAEIPLAQLSQDGGQRTRTQPVLEPAASWLQDQAAAATPPVITRLDSAAMPAAFPPDGAADGVTAPQSFTFMDFITGGRIAAFLFLDASIAALLGVIWNRQRKPPQKILESACVTTVTAPVSSQRESAASEMPTVPKELSVQPDRDAADGHEGPEVTALEVENGDCGLDVPQSSDVPWPCDVSVITTSLEAPEQQAELLEAKPVADAAPATPQKRSGSRGAGTAPRGVQQWLERRRSPQTKPATSEVDDSKCPEHTPVVRKAPHGQKAVATQAPTQKSAAEHSPMQSPGASPATAPAACKQPRGVAEWHKRHQTTGACKPASLEEAFVTSNSAASGKPVLGAPTPARSH